MAGVALGGRVCVLGPREVSRGGGRQDTGRLQLNREASSVSRWGTQLSRIYASIMLAWYPTRCWPRNSQKRGQVSPYLVPEWHKCGFKAAGTPREGLQNSRLP